MKKVLVSVICIFFAHSLESMQLLKSHAKQQEAQTHLHTNWSQESQKLVNAVQQGKKSKIKELMNDGVSADFEVSGVPLLFIPIEKSESEIVRILIEGEIDITARDSKGNTCLHAAINRQFDIRLIDLLIKSRADISAANNEGLTPMHKGALLDNQTIISLLWLAGASRDVKDVQGRTPLHCAVEANSPQAVRTLLDVQIALHPVNNAGQTAYELARQLKHDACADLIKQAREALRKTLRMAGRDRTTLFAKGNNILTAQDEETGYTALHFSVAEGDKEEVELLLRSLKALADGKENSAINIRAKKGVTALHLACKLGKADIAELLLKAGAAVNVRDDHGASPLHYIAASPTPELAKLLVEAGALINARDEKKCTPLHIATKLDRVPLMIYLLSARCKADPFSVDAQGQRPIDLANEKLRSSLFSKCIVRQLDPMQKREKEKHIQEELKKGNKNIISEIDESVDLAAIDENEKTFLHLATEADQTEIVAFLLQRGLDATVRDARQKTPLHIAASRGNLPIVEMLLHAQADVNARDSENNTPLILAARPAQNDALQEIKNEIILLLIAQGAQVRRVKNSYDETPLLEAAKRCSAQVVGALLKAGAQTIEKNSEGNCPLHVAVLEDNNEVIFYILDNCTPTHVGNPQGWGLLLLAIRKNNVALVTRIVERNAASLNFRGPGRVTPVVLALRLRHKECFDALMRKKPDMKCGVPKADGSGLSETPLSIIKSMSEVDKAKFNPEPPSLAKQTRNTAKVESRKATNEAIDALRKHTLV